MSSVPTRDLDDFGNGRTLARTNNGDKTKSGVSTMLWILLGGLIVAAVVGVGAAICIAFVRKKQADKCKKEGGQIEGDNNTKGGPRRTIDTSQVQEGDEPQVAAPAPQPTWSPPANEKPYADDENTGELTSLSDWRGGANRPIDIEEAGGSREEEARQALEDFKRERGDDGLKRRRKDSMRGEDMEAVNRDEVSIEKASLKSILGEMGEGYTIFLFIHMDKCGNCEQAMPMYREAAMRARGSGIRAYTINEKQCNPDFLDKYGVDGFPTVLRMNSKGYAQHDGPRTVADYMKFMGIGAGPSMGEDERSGRNGKK